MTVQEILTLAHEASPETIEKVAFLVQGLEQIDPEAAAEVVESFGDIAQVLQEKTAAAPAGYLRSGGGMGDFGLALGGSILAGVGASLAADMYDAARRGVTKSRNFNRIMEVNPGLKEQVDDPKRLRTAFNTLHRYAPEFTSDPSLGGSVLKNMVNLPEGSEANFITTLINGRKNLVDIKHRQFSPDSSVGQHLAPSYSKDEIGLVDRKAEHDRAKDERATKARREDSDRDHRRQSARMLYQEGLKLRSEVAKMDHPSDRQGTADKINRVHQVGSDYREMGRRLGKLGK